MLALVNNESEKEECGERETVLGNAAVLSCADVLLRLCCRMIALCCLLY